MGWMLLLIDSVAVVAELIFPVDRLRLSIISCIIHIVAITYNKWVGCSSFIKWML